MNNFLIVASSNHQFSIIYLYFFESRLPLSSSVAYVANSKTGKHEVYAAFASVRGGKIFDFNAFFVSPCTISPTHSLFNNALE